MIIDVVDMDLKTLQFSRRYDTARYKRGTQIYNKGNVEIKVVEKTDNNYKVEAVVEGNYDDYTTKLLITGNLIKDCSCTCEDFYKGNLCKHIIATSMECLDPHYASTTEGFKKLEQKRKEEEKKRLEEIKRRQEEERKKREYERKYYSGIRTIEIYKRNSKEQSKNVLDLNELYEKTNDEISGRGSFRKALHAINSLNKYGFNPILLINCEKSQINDLKEGFKELGKKFKFETEDINFSFIPNIKNSKDTETFEKPDTNIKLDCMSCRILAKSGVYNCPILLNDYRGRSGGNLQDFSKKCYLETGECQRCKANGTPLYINNWN